MNRKQAVLHVCYTTVFWGFQINYLTCLATSRCHMQQYGLLQSRKNTFSLQNISILVSVNTVHVGVILPFTTTTTTTTGTRSVRSWIFAEECSWDPLVYVYDRRRPKNTKSFHHPHLSVRPFWHLKYRIGQLCKQMFLNVTSQFQTVSSGLSTWSKEQGIHHCVIRVLVFRHSESMD